MIPAVAGAERALVGEEKGARELVSTELLATTRNSSCHVAGEHVHGENTVPGYSWCLLYQHSETAFLRQVTH